MATAMKKEFLKAKKVAHPNSRKSIAIAKRAKKITNRQKAKMSTLVKQSLVGEKMVWLKEHMIPDVCPYTPELTAQLLTRYIGRNDEEMEQIMIKRSIGGKRNRQHASREDAIRITKEWEQQEFDTCGIEIPDILNKTQCEMLKSWDGDLRFMSNFKFRRFGKKHLETLEKISKGPKKETSKSKQDEISDELKNSEEVTPNNNENEKNKANSVENSQSSDEVNTAESSQECSMDVE